MVSVLRTLQAQWNALVPQAQTLGIRRVRLLNDPLETIAYRREKLEWLRAEIARLTITTSLTPAADLSVFTFGVELEVLMPPGMSHNALAAAVRNSGVACAFEHYNHNVSQAWKVVTDGSLGDYARGAEIVSPVLRGDEGLRQLQVVCDAARQAGCKVTKKCGFHVHIGAQDWTVDTFRNLVMIYHGAEETIDAFMPPSRRASANMFCRALRVNLNALSRAHTVDQVATAIGQNPGRGHVRGAGRYCKLNLQSFWQHGTVEFRHHQGTVEADKAINWVRLCLRMALAAREGARVTQAVALETLFEVVKAPANERDFFRGRTEFFAAQARREARRTAHASASFRLPIAGDASAPDWARPAQTRPAQTAEEPNPFTEAGGDMQRRATTRNQY